MNRLPLAPIGAKDDWFTFFYRALVPKGTIKHAWIAICCREKKIGTAEKKISTAGKYIFLPWKKNSHSRKY
ncbi:MAG: hypothetical protein JXR39_03925 [Marinilabiliaceae bacterium]|nr:hypothetical protein [Marinilabiliaceae bacterium]